MEPVAKRSANESPHANAGTDTEQGDDQAVEESVQVLADPFIYRRLVTFGDTDMGGIVHFACFLRYMEEAEHAFLRSHGLSVFQRYGDAVISWPRVSVQCDYRSPARFEEVLAISVRVAKIGSKSLTYRFEMHCGARLVAEGQIVAVCCQIHEGHTGIESIPIPEPIRAKLLA